MATQTNNFTRSNVNAATLQITDPGRSSFNLGHRNELSIPFGKIVPVSTKILLPTDTFTGSLKPNFHLEKIGTPSIGATRLDTHTFVVNFRRINNDMRSNLENGKNFFPAINVYNVVNTNLGILLRSGSIDGFINGLLHSSGDNFKKISTELFKISLENLLSIREHYPQYGEHCYQLDKYIYLQDYYTDCQKNIQNLTLTSDNDPRYLFQYALPMYLKPFVGEGSLLDYLGYCSFTQYNKITAFLSNPELPVSSYATIFNEMKKYFDSGEPFVEPLMANALKIASQGYAFSSDSYNETFSELPIRAYYAVWYDYIRNWHIEERKNIIDPDNFSNKPAVPTYTGAPIIDANSVHAFSEFLSLCTLRSRDYGTDFLTSIQTDDAFRHVYSPVLSNNGVNQAYHITDTGEFSTPNPSTLLQLEIENFGSFAFPSDSTDHTVSGTNNVLATDLQTMRRSGMLEKWLARNYYYPDTYVGRLQARFGVRPSDYEVLVSQYIGGSESFISGQELVANMSTSESVVGSRNLKADVSTTDNFSGSVSDYSILVSVVSTVPIVTYDAISPAAKITDYIDYPQPEFATDTRVEARVSDFLRGFSIQPFIGYVPRYYMFRVWSVESDGNAKEPKFSISN